MNEAKFSTTIKYQAGGFDQQLTIRHDSDLNSHITEVMNARNLLTSLGAQPTHGNGNGSKPTAGPPPTPPTCKKCGSSEHMEYVSFTKDGKPKQAWKCQSCQKWAPDPPKQ